MLLLFQRTLQLKHCLQNVCILLTTSLQLAVLLILLFNTFAIKNEIYFQANTPVHVTYTDQ